MQPNRGPSPSKRRLGLFATLGVIACTSIVPATSVRAAPTPSAITATGKQTSVTFTPGKGQGSGDWGYVGDITTQTNGRTFNYGVGFNPVTGDLWVTDSGKVISSTLACVAAGLAAPCQLGTPRAFIYKQVSNDDSIGDYVGNGAYSVAGSGTPAVNDGIGAMFQPAADRTVLSAPFASSEDPNITNGPRGITFTADGTAWIVNSESQAPYGTDPATNPPGAITRLDSTGAELTGAGFTGAWADRDLPGVHFYRVGAATTPKNTVLVNSEVSDRLQEYNADGSWIRSIKLDVDPGTYDSVDPGYRNPYGVGVDPTDGSLYIPLINFRDEPAKYPEPYIEKRDADGKIVATFGSGQLAPGKVVYNVVVNPLDRHVFAWQDSGAVFEWTPDGTFVQQFTLGNDATPPPSTDNQFPGFDTIRGLAFDSKGRMYLTVQEGTTNARVMILAKTPGPIDAACAQRSADLASVTLTFECGTAATPATAMTPVKDYVVEQSVDDGATWTVVPSSPSTDTTRTVSGLDPTVVYRFRVSAWNEAGNGDWAEVRVDPTNVAVDDSATTEASTAVTVPVLANDSGPLPGSLQLLEGGTTPTDTVTVAGEGTYTVVGDAIDFVPADGFSGPTTPVKYQTKTGCAELATSARIQIVVSAVGPPTPLTTTTIASTTTTLGQATTTTTEPAVLPPTTSTRPPPVTNLPVTGSGVPVTGSSVAVTLLVAGVALVVLSRRRSF